MLILSRRQNECIDIDGGFRVGGITVCVVEICGDIVRLGIDAPKDVTIHRREVQMLVDQKEAEA